MSDFFNNFKITSSSSTVASTTSSCSTSPSRWLGIRESEFKKYYLKNFRRYFQILPFDGQQLGGVDENFGAFFEGRGLDAFLQNKHLEISNLT